MDYLIITEGGGMQCNSATDYTLALSHVGPEGWNRVQLTRDLAAWVNDCGHVLPDKYRRNPIGSLILLALGAPRMPYAGPIVITGWDGTATARGEVEVVGLTPLQLGMLYAIDDMITDARNGECENVVEGLVSDVDDLARMIVESPAPKMTFR
jgi:hypothetical protein